MNNIKILRGMRYPDEYLIRMFYKESLCNLSGKVLELGCGNASNLMHFAAYGWDITGVDFDSSSIADGQHNLRVCDFSGSLIEHDLNNELPLLNGPFQVFLAPSSLYYLKRESVEVLMRQVADILAPGALVYLRMRLPDDHRYGRGKLEGRNTYRLSCEHTGECGALNVFWHEYELPDLLENTLGIKADQMTILRTAYENLQNGIVVRNSDIVIWGRLP